MTAVCHDNVESSGSVGTREYSVQTGYLCSQMRDER
jgi:hypothetical protein